MTDQADGADPKPKIGILRRRTSTVVASSASSNVKPVSQPVRSKQVIGVNKPPVKPADIEGSLFSRRSKMIRDKPSTVPIANPPVRKPASVCHSTTTIDSRATAASQCSFSHKPGQLPAYLRNKSGSANKNIVSLQVQCNKKQFTQIKKELSDIQNKAVDTYNRYRESLVKLNKINGKTEAPTIEELKIVNFNDASASNDVKPSGTISLSQLKTLTNVDVLSQISQQVQTLQSHSFKLLQEFTGRLSEINSQIKTAGETSESGDTNLIPTKIQNLFDEVAKKIVEEENDQGSRITNFMQNLKEVMINSEGTPVMMKDTIHQEYENFKKTNDLKITELENKIKDLNAKKLQDKHKNDELVKNIATEQASVNELKTVIAQLEAKRDEHDNEIKRLSQKCKQVELNNKRCESLLEAKTNEIALKEKSIVELKQNIKTLQDKLLKNQIHNQKLESKLARAEEEAKAQMELLKAKYEEENKKCNQLSNEISCSSQMGKDDNRPLLLENERLKYNQKALETEIYNLKQNIIEKKYNATITDKETIEEQVCRREIDSMRDELKKSKILINELKDAVNNSENQLMKKIREISELETMIKQVDHRDKLNEYQIEIIKLKELNNQKTKENEQFQAELNKTVTELRLKDESIFVQQRLLKIRTELIQSLQSNEDAFKSQMVDAHTNPDKDVERQVHPELSSKAEELDNLFSTLGEKNLEVKRQDYIIKQLEDTNNRNQRIRVQQEEKISRLQLENSDLKRLIKYKN